VQADAETDEAVFSGIDRWPSYCSGSYSSFICSLLLLSHGEMISEFCSSMYEVREVAYAVQQSWQESRHLDMADDLFE
jgi:hypothetical protein